MESARVLRWSTCRISPLTFQVPAKRSHPSGGTSPSAKSECRLRALGQAAGLRGVCRPEGFPRTAASENPRSARKWSWRAYRQLQQDGKLQRAVREGVVAGLSTRNYRRAVERVVEGYGIEKSSVGRPNRIADGTLPSDQRTVDRWFDTNAFVALTASTPNQIFGNSGVGVSARPGARQFRLQSGEGFHCHRAGQNPVPFRVFQCVQPRQLRRAGRNHRHGVRPDRQRGGCANHPVWDEDRLLISRRCN